MFSFSFPFLLLLTRIFLALAADVNINFDVANSVIAPDGFDRTGVIVNGVFPGPLIQAHKDDVLHITTNNFLTDPTMRYRVISLLCYGSRLTLLSCAVLGVVIQFIGTFQMRTSSEDGPAFVNQCPVAPAHSYTYDSENIVLFIISRRFSIIAPPRITIRGRPSRALGNLRCVKFSSEHHSFKSLNKNPDPDDPYLDMYDVDNADTVITLADWYHNPSIGLSEKYLQVNPFHEPIPDSGLINGKGRYVGGPTVDWARINVQPGLRYRFRIINTSGYSGYTFSIEGHSLTIIEVDGIYHEPLTVDAFDIYVGQRYSFIVTANQPVANYWVSAPMELQHSSDNDNLDTNNVFAVLHYEGADDGDPKSNKASLKQGNVLEEHLLVPLRNPEAPGGSNPADRVIDLHFTRTTNDATGHLEWTINDISYKSPDLPTLFNIMINGFTEENQFSVPEHTFVLAPNEVVEVVIHGSANGHIHPFHLHGHVFSIVQGRDGPANFINPPQRDVVGVGGTVLYLSLDNLADNPGPWFLHCHIDWHLEAGLAVVFAEAPKEEQAGPKSEIIKQTWVDLCTIYAALPPELQ
ncbi:related to Laccase-2 [Armillaria ostoyae]|uniref:Related to Laccase-2 n=1 Tax=Armillaria ostoyae TaxID=47428 RepID=A0A284R519_ARMOS|nr:related to Laccase-2 [Armillaria ostoyae]